MGESCFVPCLWAVPPGLSTPAGAQASPVPSWPRLAPVLLLARSSGADPLLLVVLAKRIVGDK